MRPITTDGVACSVWVSVCLLVTFVNLAEEIKMLFKWVCQMSLRNHELDELDGCLDLPKGMGNFQCCPAN